MTMTQPISLPKHRTQWVIFQSHVGGVSAMLAMVILRKVGTVLVIPKKCVYIYIYHQVGLSQEATKTWLNYIQFTGIYIIIYICIIG